MKAIKIVSAGHAEIQEVRLPKLRDDYVLVKVKCVACETNQEAHCSWIVLTLDSKSNGLVSFISITLCANHV